LVQETLVAALTSTFRGESKVRTWLVQILVRRAALLRRSRKRQHGETLANAVGATLADESRPMPSGSPDTAASDARIDLARMLEALTPEHRQIIVLRELEGMSYDEMAAALGVPRGTVESRLHRARGVLKEKFKGYL
jgi:RNA polymerase sigma-70 factor (ECF subfamily)